MHIPIRWWVGGLIGLMFFLLQACAQDLWQQHMDAGQQAFQAGRYAEAEQSLLAALEEAEGFGPQDPRLMTSLNNLAGLYYAQGKYAQAEPLLKRALALHKERLGPEHVEVATALQNLALLYDVQNRYTEAEPLYLQALALKEKILGVTNPSTIKTIENYALFLRKRNRTAEAIALESRIRHPQAISSAGEIARSAVLPTQADTTREVTISYDEPTTSKDGSLLTDLAKTTIYYDAGHGPVKVMEVPATAPTGGGTITRRIAIPVSGEATSRVTIWVTATDLNGNESPHSKPLVIEGIQ